MTRKFSRFYHPRAQKYLVVVVREPGSACGRSNCLLGIPTGCRASLSLLARLSEIKIDDNWSK